MPALQFCTFYLDGLLFGIELKGVQEVIHSLDMTQVPLAPAVVSGLINLRGQIVTAVDLRRRLELKPAPPELHVMNVVVRSDDGAGACWSMKSAMWWRLRRTRLSLRRKLSGARSAP